MDGHDKLQAVFPQQFDSHNGMIGVARDRLPSFAEAQQELSFEMGSRSDTPYEAVGNDEMAEDHVEKHGGGLRRVLVERQINMIAFSCTIGNGLFLSSGRTIARAGPGGAVLAYALVGTIIASTISCLGEMTALMPVNAPMVELPRRFLDRGVGFAVGWLYLLAFAITTGQQLAVVVRAVQFTYDDGTTNLFWKTGNRVDPAVWFTIFLLLAVLLNMLKLEYFAEVEYIFGCIKLIAIIILIVTMLILATITPRENAYYTETIGVKYWKAPYTFFNHDYKVVDESGSVQRVISGSIGTFLGEWTSIIATAWSYTGMDVFAATTAESKALGNAESMKMAARKVSIRVVTVYCFAVFTASFVVSPKHPFLNGGAKSIGESSIFIIAFVEAGIPKAAHFLNALLMLSCFSSAADNIYISSRVLHIMALRDQTGPAWITERLRKCNSGVPRRAALVTAALGLFGYMGRTGTPSERLDQISHADTVSLLLVFGLYGATYLCFWRKLEDVKSEAQISASSSHSAFYDRNHPRYPYKSHGQWLKACCGMTSCFIMLLFSGARSFLTKPFDSANFIISYISIPVFLSLILGYKISKHGFHVSRWGPERSCDLSGAIQASEKRVGRLEFKDNAVTAENIVTFIKWLWVWLK